jgi:gliding motility-associated-like protein
VSTSGDCDGIEIQPPVPGTETYIYTGINDFGCTFELPVEITVVQGPEIDISSAQSYCGAPIDLEATVTNPQPGFTYSYQWSPGGFIVGSSTGTSVTVDDVDALTNFSFTVDVSGAQIDNCSATATVAVNPLVPPVDFGPIDRLICIGEGVALVVGNQPAGLDEYTYVWTHTYVDNFGVTQTEQVGTTPALEATEAGTYNVVISMPAPCTWTAEGTFIVETELCELTIPNVFSPDNLGKNDAFLIDGLDAYPLSTMRIYNRWGALVYSHDDFGNTAGWNPGPEDASEGTYYFVLGINRTASELNVVDETGAYVVDGEGMHYISGSFALVR